MDRLILYYDIPRQKCCFHFSREKGICTRQKERKNKKSAFVSSRVFFFNRTLFDQSTRCEMLKFFFSLEFVKQHVYANHFIFLWMKKRNINGFILEIFEQVFLDIFFFNENPSPGVNNFWMLIVGKVNSCQLFIQEKFELIFIHKCLSIEKYRYTYVIPPSMIELWPSESPPETFDSFLKIIQKFSIASSI